MQRVKLLKKTKYGKMGETVVIDNNEAFGLIDSGQAQITKDMNSDDYLTSGDTNGNTVKLRTHNKG
jgi:hypothetical protein